MGGLTEPDLNEYYDTFAKFNTYINDIHKQSKLNQHHEGYLVNHKDYIELEKLVDKYYQEKQKEFRNNFYNRDETKWIDIIKSKKLRTQSLEDVRKQISNVQKFIIINNDIYAKICKKPESEQENHKINYYIEDKDHLIIYSADKKGFRFKNNNNNIIEKSEDDNNTKSSNLIHDWQKYEKDWKEIYTDTKNYFINENDISEHLKTGQDKMIQGFLINKEWVDKWKKYSYYERIKENFYLKNITKLIRFYLNL